MPKDVFLSPLCAICNNELLAVMGIPVRRSSHGNLLFDAGIQPDNTERASRQMRLFVFSEIYGSHHEFVQPLNPNVHTVASAP